MLGTDTEQGYHALPAPGRPRHGRHRRSRAISEEKATGAGVGYFITTRTTFTDQDGEEVGWMTFRVLKYIPQGAPRPRRPKAARAEAYAPARLKPPMGHDNAWWWQAVSDGRIEIQKCSDCGELRHPPRPMCSACRSMKWESQEISGRGTLHTYTVIHYPQFPGYEFPILAALVDLEEGCRMVSNVVGCSPEDLAIGMAVEAFIHEDDDGFKLPFFRPVKQAR